MASSTVPCRIAQLVCQVGLSLEQVNVCVAKAELFDGTLRWRILWAMTGLHTREAHCTERMIQYGTCRLGRVPLPPAFGSNVEPQLYLLVVVHTQAHDAYK